MKTHLHFTFGPVQSFVAQARRTRDLYAGSFLLSHLAMQAMKATQTTGGKVVLPEFDKLQQIGSDYASAPNRFVAEFSDESAASAAGAAAKDALHETWRVIAEVVWKRFLAPVASQGLDTPNIWNRQRDSFWEIAWAVGKPEESNLLDRRKNWRTLPTTSEGGDLCTLMGQWQELSGFIHSQQRKQQDDFWMAVRRQFGDKQLDLEEDERLCAIAFIKRFFPSVSKEAVGRELDLQSWPSTVTIAAIPWLRTIKKTASFHAAAAAYADSVRNEPGSMVSSFRRIALTKDFPESAD